MDQETHTKINIGTSTGTFTTGLQIEGHGMAGSAYDQEIDHMSSDCKAAALVIGLKFVLSDPSVGPKAIETLNMLKELLREVEIVKDLLEKGLDNISFRHENENVFINIRFPVSVDSFKDLPLDKLDLTDKTFTGRHDFKVNLGINPTKLMTCTLDEAIEMISNFSMEQKFDADLHYVINAVVKFMSELFVSNQPARRFLIGIKMLMATRSLGLDYKYDPTVVREVLKEMIDSMGSESVVKNLLAQYQEMIKMMVPQAQQMAPMFIGPYKELLQGLNLGHVEFFFMVPKLRFYVRPGVTLFGLNDYLQENFVNK